MPHKGVLIASIVSIIFLLWHSGPLHTMSSPPEPLLLPSPSASPSPTTTTFISVKANERSRKLPAGVETSSTALPALPIATAPALGGNSNTIDRRHGSGTLNNRRPPSNGDGTSIQEQNQQQQQHQLSNNRLETHQEGIRTTPSPFSWEEELLKVKTHYCNLTSAVEKSFTKTLYLFPAEPSNRDWLTPDYSVLPLYDRRATKEHSAVPPKSLLNRRSRSKVSGDFWMHQIPMEVLNHQPLLRVQDIQWQPDLFQPNPTNSSRCFQQFGPLTQRSTEKGGNLSWSPQLQRCVGVYANLFLHSVQHWEDRAQKAAHPMANIIHGGVNPPKLMSQSFAIANAGGLEKVLKDAHTDLANVVNADGHHEEAAIQTAATTTIVELGCGNGNLLFAMCPPHPNVRCHGTDYSEKMVQYAQAYFGSWIDFRHGIGAGHIPSGSADLVLSNAVAMYLTGQQLCTHVAEGMRLLKPGGKMIIVALTPGEFSNKVSGHYFADPEKEGGSSALQDYGATASGPGRSKKGGPAASSAPQPPFLWDDDDDDGEVNKKRSRKRRVLMPFCGAVLRHLVEEVEVIREDPIFPLYGQKSPDGSSSGFYVASITRSTKRFCNRSRRTDDTITTRRNPHKSLLLQTSSSRPSALIQSFSPEEMICPTQKDHQAFAKTHPAQSLFSNGSSYYSSAAVIEAKQYLNIYDWFSHAKHLFKDKQTKRKYWTISKDRDVLWGP